jgi:hypothetical protein
MTKDERHQTHTDAITAQLGTGATPASLLLAQRIAGLAVLCEEHEAGRLKGARDYMNAAKLMQSLCIAIGVVLNPRTATSRQRAAAAHDDHAALMLDDED